MEGELPPPSVPEHLAATHALPTPPAEARRFHHYEVELADDGVSLRELGRGAIGVAARWNRRRRTPMP